MGEVYRATDTKLGREVAIKVLPANFSRDPQSLARFEREAKALATLNHPNVAAIHGFEADQGTHFLVLELVEGETLGERLRRGAFPVKDALTIARQIVEAIQEAHEKGIIHRDLKPGNVKITPNGRVKVLDFGLAKLVVASERASVSASGRSDAPRSNAPDVAGSPPIIESTQPGMVLGTPAYMSPEQARGQEVDKRTRHLGVWLAEENRLLKLQWRITEGIMRDLDDLIEKSFAPSGDLPGSDSPGQCRPFRGDRR